MQETTAGDLHDIAFMDPLRSAMNSSPTFVVIDACVESPQFQARDQISGERHISATCPSTCASSKVDAGYQFLHSNAAPQRGEDRRRQLWVKYRHRTELLKTFDRGPHLLQFRA